MCNSSLKLKPELIFFYFGNFMAPFFKSVHMPWHGRNFKLFLSVFYMLVCSFSSSAVFARDCQISIDVLMEQRRLQTILDSERPAEYISAMLNANGELGEVLSRYMHIVPKLETLDLYQQPEELFGVSAAHSVDGLENVVTHRVINALIADMTKSTEVDILGVYNQVSELDYRHCIFDEHNDFFWGMVSTEALSMRQTDIWQKRRLIQSLRRVARSGLPTPYADEYVNLLGRSSLPRFIYDEEIEYWNEVLEEGVCQNTPDKDCLGILAFRLADLRMKNSAPILDRYICDIKLIHKDHLYAFQVC